MARDWDAKTYDTAAAPVHTMGHALLERLELEGGETVLDAGCGSGAVTAVLLERLPRGRVIAVDGSASMIERARGVLDPERTELIECDLLDLDLHEAADVAFSSATFHWVPDHPRLFARLHEALRPGGRLLAQYGGAGNIAEILAVLEEITAREPFAPHFAGWTSPWTYDSPEDAARMLEEAGFAEVETSRQVVELTFEDVDGYLRSTILLAHLERLPAALGDAFVAGVAERLGDPIVTRYVRTNLAARRPG